MARRKRNLTSEVTWSFAATGLDKVKSAITAATDVMTQATRAYHNNIDALKIMRRADLQFGDAASDRADQVAKATYLHGQFREAVAKLGKGFNGLTGVAEDQAKAYKDVEKITSRLLRDNEKHQFLTVEMAKEFKGFNTDLEKVNENYDDYKNKLEIINNAMVKATSFGKELFGTLSFGSKEANEGFEVLKKTFLAMTKIFGPFIDKAKKGLAALWAKGSSGAKDWLMEKAGGGIQSRVDALKKAGIGKGVAGATGKAAASKATKGLNAQNLKAIKSTKSLNLALGGATKGAKGMAAGMRLAAVGVSLAGAAIVAVVAIALAALMVLVKGIQMNIDTMEKFRHTGFRANGSIRELTNSTFKLSGELGVTTKQAAETITALSEAGLSVDKFGDSITDATGKVMKGQDALRHMAKENTMLTHSTGMAAGVVADLRVQMVALNIAGADQTKIMDTLSDASRRYGLQGKHLNKITQALNKSFKLQRVYFKGTDTKKYTAAVVGLAGAARKAKVGIEAATSFVEQFDDVLSTNSITLLAFGGALDEAFSKDPNQTKLVKGGIKGAVNLMKMYEDVPAAIRKVALERRGISADQQAMFAPLLKLEGKALEAAVDRMTAEKEANNALKKNYNESMKTVTQSWNRLMGQIMPMIAEMAGPLVDEVIKFFDENKDWMRNEMIPTLKSVFKVAVQVFEIFFSIMKAIGPIAQVLMTVLKPAFDAIATVVGGIKDLFFSSSFLHIKEGIAVIMPVLVAFKGIWWGITKVLKVVKGMIGGVFKLAGKAIGAVAGLAKKAAGAVKGLLGMKRKAARGTKNSLLGMSGKTTRSTKNSFFSKLLSGVGTGLIPLTYKAGKALFGSKKKEEAKKKSGPKNRQELLAAMNAVKDVSPAIRKSMLSSFGVTPDQQILMADELKKSELKPKPVYTVQFGKDTAGNKETRMVSHLGQISSNMKDLVEKRDPDATRMADAMEAANDRERRKPPEHRKASRLQQGSGEVFNDWYV